MPRRRRLLFASLCLIVLPVLAMIIIASKYPPLSTTEHRILGTWVTPHPTSVPRYVTSKGPVTNPSWAWEFRRDRSFRVWIISADDSEVLILDKEGRWSAEGANLTLEGFGPTGDAIREIRERVRMKLGGSYVGRSSGTLTHSIRFLDRDNLGNDESAGDVHDLEAQAMRCGTVGR